MKRSRAVKHNMQEIAMSPLPYKVMLWLFAFCIVLPFGSITIALLFVKTPINGKVQLFSLAVGILAFLVLLVFAWTRNSVKIESKKLIIETSLYSESIDLEDLLIDSGRVIDLETNSEPLFRSRKSGIGLPGYQSGWFILNDGSNAFVSRTSNSVLFLPTKKNFSLVISVTNPQQMLEMIRRSSDVAEH